MSRIRHEIRRHMGRDDAIMEAVLVDPGCPSDIDADALAGSLWARPTSTQFDTMTVGIPGRWRRVSRP